MPQRSLGPFHTSAIGLGCMNLSHAYGTPPEKAFSIELLNRALDMGYSLLDTAALYGFGANESLVGEAVMTRRHEFVLASKCGLIRGADGKREINGRPEVIRKTCEAALRRLNTEVIDLYYLHRLDPYVPIEDSVGAMGDLRREGKIRSLGLSEVSADTLMRAHREHPIAALQTEYSLWSRNAEIAVLDLCRQLDIAFVAFSPLGRGFLTDALPEPDSFEEKDIRRAMPRFQAEHWPHNTDLARQFADLASHTGYSRAQLALGWLLAQGDHIIPIPGTTSLDHLTENFSAAEIDLGPSILKQLDQLINQQSVSGGRYNEATQKEIDTEQF